MNAHFLEDLGAGHIWCNVCESAAVGMHVIRFYVGLFLCRELYNSCSYFDSHLLL